MGGPLKLFLNIKYKDNIKIFKVQSYHFYNCMQDA